MTTTKLRKTEAIGTDGKIWNKDMIRELLKVNDKAVIKGLLIIYNYQTEDEKADKETSHDNGMGFNGLDAEFLSDMVEKYNKYGKLTNRQMKWTRIKMLKYAGQLIKHMQHVQQVREKIENSKG